MVYDYIITKPPLDEECLAHYGIKGMKWRSKKKKKAEKLEDMSRRLKKRNKNGDLTDKGFDSSKSNYKLKLNTATGKVEGGFDKSGVQVGAGLRAARERKAIKDKNDAFVKRGTEAGRERVKKKK